jgi:hypothetical protein
VATLDSLTYGDVMIDRSDLKHPLNEGGDESREAEIVRDDVIPDRDASVEPLAVRPADDGQARGGVPAGAVSGSQLPQHVDGAFECSRLRPQHRGPLHEEESRRGERIAPGQVRGVAVGLLEPVRQVLGE